MKGGACVISQCRRTGQSAPVVFFLRVSHVVDTHILKVGREISVAEWISLTRVCFPRSDLCDYAEERSGTAHGKFVLLGQLH